MTPSDSLFSRRREIRQQDTDAAGIVYTPRIAHLVVETVEDWFLNRLSPDWTGQHGAGQDEAGQDGAGQEVRMVFASLSCTFLSPMRPGDILEIRIALRRIGRSSLGFELVGHADSDDRLCWMAETVCVFVDTATLRSRLIPQPLRQILDAEAALAIRMPFGDRTLDLPSKT